MNKKGDFSVVLLVFLSLMAVGVTLFSFINSSNKVNADVVNPQVVEDVYVQEEKVKFQIKSAGEKALTETYKNFAEKDDYLRSPIIYKNIEGNTIPEFNYLSINLDERFLNEFRKNFLEEIRGYGFENEFEISGSATSGIFEIKTKLNLMREVKNTEGEKVLEVYYKPDLKIQLDFEKLSMINFNRILDLKNSCRKGSDFSICSQGAEKEEFDLKVVENSEANANVVYLKSKNEFLIDNVFEKISFEFVAV